MYDDHTPNPAVQVIPTSLPPTHRGMKAIVRRARLEHLAMELLRLGNALRLPVPVERLYEYPPLRLWRIDPRQTSEFVMISEDYLQNRLNITRAVARLVGESQWEARIRMIGDAPFSSNEVEVFTMALLMPTALLAGISEKQRTPAFVSTIFQVPIAEATMRLGELGYLSPLDNSAARNDISTG
jgi:hypothetical protein